MLAKGRHEIRIGQKFDPSKPSRLKDTGVLSWGIFSKNVLFFQQKNGSKKAKSLTPVNPLDKKIQAFYVEVYFHI